MARELERPRRDGARPVLVTGPEFLAGKLRVLTEGRIAIDSWSQLDPARDSWPAAMILPVSQAASLDLKGYRAREVATEFAASGSGTSPVDAEGQVPEFLDARRDRYVIAIRR
jgi:hypothetical protein